MHGARVAGRVRMHAGATGSHWHLHAWQDPDAEDFAHPDLPCPSVAEDPRIAGHGPLPGAICTIYQPILFYILLATDLCLVRFVLPDWC